MASEQVVIEQPEPTPLSDALAGLLRECEAARRDPEVVAAAELRRRELEAQWRWEEDGNLTDDRRNAEIPSRIVRVFKAGPIDVTEAVKAARKFRDSSDHSVLVLAGPCGTGKTVAAVEAMHNGRETTDYVGERRKVQRCAGRFVRAMELARASSYGPDAVAFWKKLEREPALLVIDDLGAGIRSDYGLANITATLCARYDADRRTVITTNAAKTVFEREFLADERLRDRFREGAVFHWLKGSSLRTKASGGP